MKKNIKIVCLWFFLVAFNLPVISKGLDVKCKAELCNDSLKVQFEIKNNGSKDIFFQNQFWEFGGSEITNSFLLWIAEGYLVNSIYMTPAKLEGIRYRSEKMDYPHITNIDNPILLHAKSKTYFKVLLKLVKKTTNKLKLTINMPYFYNKKFINSKKLDDKKNNFYINLYHRIYYDGDMVNILCENGKYTKLLNITNYKNSINDNIDGYIRFSCIVKEKNAKK